MIYKECDREEMNKTNKDDGFGKLLCLKTKSNQKDESSKTYQIEMIKSKTRFFILKYKISFLLKAIRNKGKCKDKQKCLNLDL